MRPLRQRHTGRGAALLLLVTLAGAVGSGAAEQPLVGRVVRDYALAAPDALFMPTDVAVAADGTVYVADGVNHRVAIFDADGAPRGTFTHVGDQPLANPLGLHVDAAGQLWITDAGRGLVLVRGGDGELVRSVPRPEGAVELADALPTADGRAVWLADNDGHRLWRVTLDDGAATPHGRLGESLGEYNYPFLLAAAGEDVLVVDVLNGRVQRLDGRGRVVGAVGAYGVDVGQFYRPKGVAVDATGHVWVSDGTLNVVQAFTPLGGLRDVLRDEHGAPLRLAYPMGLAFDAGGDLYVVELMAHRVRRFAITRADMALGPAPPVRRPPAGRAEQSGACTVCHFDWMRPLVDGRGTELADVPAYDAAHPLVSRSEMCLSCHDGSVGDSRRRVWVEHGHARGIVPPETVRVPASLPLADGRIECRTCHSAHTAPDRTTVADIVFLRGTDSPTELCVQCHTDYADGAARGMHPMVTRPRGVDAAASGGAVSCTDCHSGHGAPYAQLLLDDPRGNNLCLSCHIDVQPALFSDATRSGHGREPVLDAAQRAVVAGLGTPLGPGETLLCRTCHAPHHAPVARQLLTFDPAQQDACAACHPAQRGVAGSVHDLAATRPDARNMLGVTAGAGGTCSACHTAHQYARPVVVAAGDVAGRCTSCHQAGDIAAAKVLGPVNHPSTDCGECHDPHAGSQTAFLKTAAAAETCVTCHADQAAVALGAHGVTRAADRGAWPAGAAATGDACLACHRPHGTADTGLFRVAPATATVDGDGACLACHVDARPDGGGQLALLHPQTPAAAGVTAALPLGHADGAAAVACRTCHDPHGGAAATALLRVAEGTPGERMCMQCHTDVAHIDMIGHGASVLRDAGLAAGNCRPCHVTHGAGDAVTEGLWPKLLDAPAEVLERTHVVDRSCVACHRTGGAVAPPSIATHPVVEMYNPVSPDAAGFLPLYDAEGRVSATGTITCATCHLTHGRDEPAPMPAGVDGMSGRELRARRWHVRSLGAENVCTTCHGVDALRRFMYFHDPARRGGPIEGR